MRYLVDTHVFVWWMGKSKRLSNDIYSLLNNPENHIFLSVASVWEIIIKRQKKKTFFVPKDIEKGVKASGFIVLPIQTRHVLEIEKLPLYHKDPFDRILIAQTQVENLTFITSDKKIQRYNIPLLKV